MGNSMVLLLPEKQRQARKYAIKNKIRREFDRISRELNVAYNNDLDMLRAKGVKITHRERERLHKQGGYQIYQKQLQRIAGEVLRKVDQLF